jgi:prolyl oligopeptidase PreP (S9A serine peptidase family)
MSGTMLRSNYSDLVLADALPALEFIVQDEFQSDKPKYEQIFNIKQMKTGIAQSTQVSSLQPAGAVGEAEQVPLQKVYQGYAKTYTAVKYGIMLASSQELLDDLEYDVMGQNARKLSKAFMSTVEITAASIFNDGFGDTGPDGQALFSASHPLLAPGAGTASNLLGTPADLSSTTLKQLMTLLRSTVDSAGNKVMIAPKYLLVHPDNEFLAKELCASVFLPNSDNAYVNSENIAKSEYGMKPIVWDYLTDADAVFVCGDKGDHMLNFWWRKQPAISTEYDFKTEVALTKLVGRFTAGYSDWRGVVGTSGAG